MIVDIYNFAHKKQVQGLTDLTLDPIYDFGAPNRAGECYPFDFFFGCDGETTATGTPSLDIILESADDVAFTENKTEHVLFKGVPKNRLTKNNPPLVVPLPYGVRRFARLKLDATSEIACTTFSAGITPNGQHTNNRVAMSDSMTHWAPDVRP